jgi:uncharacterized metal-binding protein YceD (DUF177 family)
MKWISQSISIASRNKLKIPRPFKNKEFKLKALLGPDNKNYIVLPCHAGGRGFESRHSRHICTLVFCVTYFSHIINLEKAHNRGRPESFTASKEQCSLIMEVFDLLDLKSFTIQFQVELLINGAYNLRGSLNAVVVQPSAVSCEPVTTSISEPFSIMLVPSQKRLHDYEESHPDDDCDIFAEGEYDVGNLSLEYLSLSLPTYPRLPGESGDYVEFDDSKKEEAPSPFATLADKLKDKK